MNATTRTVWEMAGLATPMSLRVAATLRLADHVEGSGATAVELAARTGTNADALVRVLDHLVAVGIFRCADGRYRTTELGDQLRADDEGALRDDLDVTSAIGRAELAFVELLHTVTTGGSAYPRRYGRDFWADVVAQPALQRSFDTKMDRRFREYAPQIAQRFDWGRFREVVDVGGGQGTLLTAVLRAHPKLRGRLVDLPATATSASRTFAAAGLDGRASAVAGSFFDPLPPGADAYILSDILHNWDDDRAGAILARCAEAAGTGGTVLVIEPLRGRGADTAIVLSMLVFFGGHERSVEEIAELAAGYGLVLQGETRVADGRTLLELVHANA